MFDLHAAITALREGYWRFRPHAEKDGTAPQLDATQSLLESLPREQLALAPVQTAVARLLPIKDDHGRRFRGNILSFLTLMGSPICEVMYDGMADSHRAAS